MKFDNSNRTLLTIRLALNDAAASIERAQANLQVNRFPSGYTRDNMLEIIRGLLVLEEEDIVIWEENGTFFEAPIKEFFTHGFNPEHGHVSEIIDPWAGGIEYARNLITSLNNHFQISPPLGDHSFGGRPTE